MNDHYELSKQNTNSSFSSNGFFNIKRLILILLAFFAMHSIKASHVSGGDITWECLPNGDYIFHLNIYHANNGASFPFSGARSISYQNGQFSVYPDSISYNQINDPNNCGLFGNEFEVLPFKSNPVSLGAAPPNGWLFTFSRCCMSGSIDNVANAQTQGITLRAKMYNTSAGCNDNSPKFVELPERYIPNGLAYNFGNLAIDPNKDSLVYFFDTPWSSATIVINWENGYSQSSPFPGPNQDSSNIAAQIESANGSVSGEVHNIQTALFAYSIRVDSYREGIKIASVWREANIYVFDLQALSATINNFPILLMDSNSSNTHQVNVTLGESINIPIFAFDMDSVLADSSNPNSRHPQIIKLSAAGMMFAKDFSDPNNCIDSNASCATLNPSLVMDTNGSYFLTDSGTVITTFNWLTTCSLLESTDTNAALLNSRLYNFGFTAKDENCLSAYSSKTLAIKVERYEPLLQKNGNQLYVGLADSYQWYYNNTPIANSDTNIIAIQGNGSYSVQVMKYGCPSIKTSLDVITSIKDFSLPDAKVHPNPFRNGFQIEVPHPSSENLEFRMLDLRGREVESSITKSPKGYYLEVGKNLQQGIYILEIASENQSILKKMIKL